MSLELLRKDEWTTSQKWTNGISDSGTRSITFRRGELIALRTKAEIENSGLQTVPACMIEIPQRSANDITKVIEALIREHEGKPSHPQHLRRIVKPCDVPVHLRRNPSRSSSNSVLLSCTESDLCPTLSSEELNDREDNNVQETQPSLYLLVPSTSALPLQTLSATLKSLLPSVSPVATIFVPRYPPTSFLEAHEWSLSHWPTVYRKSNPFGPQLANVKKAEDSILPSVGQWMAIAVMAGADAEARGLGMRSGAAIVEKGLLVAVAGDGRWVGCDGIHAADRVAGQPRGHGNPMAHAAMRAIGLVARKRQDAWAQHLSAAWDPGAGRHKAADNEQLGQHFLDKPLTAMENAVYKDSTIKAGGYLCHDMEIYLTHEPCVMCAMAILHSRLGKVVYGRRMVATGGLCVEVEDAHDASHKSRGFERGHGHGLFWRQELNWRLLAWWWKDEDPNDYNALGWDVHA